MWLAFHCLNQKSVFQCSGHGHTHTHKKKSNKSLKIRQILLLGFYVVILLVFTYFIPPWYKSPIKVKICSCHCCVKLLLNSSIAEGQWSPYSAVCGVVGSWMGWEPLYPIGCWFFMLVLLWAEGCLWLIVNINKNILELVFLKS